MDKTALGFAYMVGILLGITFFVGLVGLVLAIIIKLWKILAE